MVVRCNHMSSTASCCKSTVGGEMLIDEPVSSLPPQTSASTLPFEHALMLHTECQGKRPTLCQFHLIHHRSSTRWASHAETLSKKNCQTCSLRAISQLLLTLYGGRSPVLSRVWPTLCHCKQTTAFHTAVCAIHMCTLLKKKKKNPTYSTALIKTMIYHTKSHLCYISYIMKDIL